MRISYLTVSVNYADYLAIAHKHNLGLFDDYTVVTSFEDRVTQEFCRENRIGYVVTDAFYQGGAAFNKGAGLNEGLKALAQSGHPLDWVAIMDADTFVPSDFRVKLAALQPPLDPEFLYGARRVMLPTRADYEDWTSGRKTDKEFESPNGFGFGFLQLINWRSRAIQQSRPNEWYPSYPDATCCDWMFFNKWGDLADEYTRAVGNVRELPFSVYNLGPHGTNHQGRRSGTF